MKYWTVGISPEAQKDLASISMYYREVAPEQVARFRNRYKEVLSTIREWPYLNQEDRPNVHHYKVPVFPYNVFYTIHEDDHSITITAVLHQRRDPTLAVRRTEGHTHWA